MNDMVQLLALMDRPAFFVQDGCVTAANTAAQARGVQPGMRVEELLPAGTALPVAPAVESLGVLLSIGCEATVTALQQGLLFTMEPEESDSDQRMLSLAAQVLREPVGNAMALTYELDGDAAPKLRRELYRILRIVGNLSAHPALRLEMQDVNAVLSELWDKARPACESRGVTLTYSAPPAPVYSCIDSQLLTRAIHNLLSNSLKYAPSGSKLHLELKPLGRSYQILLLDQGDTPWPLPDPFGHSRREPGVGDGREGLGMGLRLVRQAATAHGGTVLLDSPPQGGLRVTMTLPLRQIAPMRSPRFRLSYTGERDPMLVELCDVRPPELYQ